MGGRGHLGDTRDTRDTRDQRKQVWVIWVRGHREERGAVFGTVQGPLEPRHLSRAATTSSALLGHRGSPELAP